MYRIIEFASEGAVIRGRLYSHPDASEPAPIVIMAHGFSATISGMVADHYAEGFAAAGFAVLLYDHRNFGISGGEPRQEINRWVQARGYRDAIDFVTTLPGIDLTRIALWGDSMSGGEVVVAGSIDRRVKAIVAQVPAFGDHGPPPDPDGALFEAIRDTFLHGDVTTGPHTTTGGMPVVSSDQHRQPSLLAPLTAFRWFIEYGGRYGTEWQNWASLVVPETPAPFHAGLCATHLHAALLLVIAKDDEMEGANSEVSRAVFALAPEPKQLIEMDGGHFGVLEHPSSLVDEALDGQQVFLVRHLMQSAPH